MLMAELLWVLEAWLLHKRGLGDYRLTIVMWRTIWETRNRVWCVVAHGLHDWWVVRRIRLRLEHRLRCGLVLPTKGLM